MRSGEESKMFVCGSMPTGSVTAGFFDQMKFAVCKLLGLI